MSSAYSSFPSTKGKIVLTTSSGDIEIELWPKEAPLATRNFVQLCMEGYYDNTPIHRIIPNFIVQMGDPTGTGLGGESIYKKPFKDEIHSRLRFTTRGLLAMANTARDQNQSQFFITLKATPELNGKNTIFGRVVGDTLFNVLRLGEFETDKDDKPIYDARIISSTILSNPFDDIVPRTTREEILAKQKESERKRLEQEKLLKPKGIKNLSLLSFGEEASKDEEVPKTKIKSSHDLIDDVRLSKEVAKSETKQDTSSSISKKRKSAPDSEQDQGHTTIGKPTVKRKESAETKELSMQDQIKKLQSEIKQIGAPKKQIPVVKKIEKTSVAKLTEEYLSSGKAVRAYRKDIKGDVVARLKGFTSQLRESEQSKKNNLKKQTKIENDWECPLHFIKNCSSCRDTFGETVEEDDEDWMNATLQFPKQVGANVFEPKIDDYTVVDPRQGAKADPFGRDIQVLGDIQARQKAIWTEKSTRKVKSLTEQFIEQPEFLRQ